MHIFSLHLPYILSFLIHLLIVSPIKHKPIENKLRLMKQMINKGISTSLYILKFMRSQTVQA